MKKETLEEIALLKELIDNPNNPEEEKELYRKTIKDLEIEAATEEKPKAPAKPTPKSKKTAPKVEKIKVPAKPKKLPVDADKMKAEIRERTGKTEEECEQIIAEYRKTREKSNKNRKQRLEELKEEGKVISGTSEKTAGAVIEDAATKIKEKIEKQVDQIEKEADKGNRTPEQIEARITRNLDKLSKEMTQQATTFIKGIQAELAKADKTEAKQFLMNVREEIDELLSKFAEGGWLRDHNHVNKSEDYEVRYDKNHPSSRSGYQKKKFSGGGSVEPITERQKDELVDYVYRSYGKEGSHKKDVNGGFTRTQIARAVDKYVKQKPEMWGGGDTVDKMMVMEILVPGFNNLDEFDRGGSVDSDISRYKKQLIQKAKNKGLYENFGQDEVRKLEDKYGYTPEVESFDNWAMNFDLEQLKRYDSGGMVQTYNITQNMGASSVNPGLFARGGGVGGKDLFSMSKTIIENGKIVEMVIAENVSVKEFNKLFTDKGYRKVNDTSLVGFYFVKPNGDTIQLIPSFHKKGEVVKYENGGSVPPSFENNRFSDEEFEYRVNLGKRQIIEDIQSGVVDPSKINDFSDLHLFVDGNYYGGIIEDDYEHSEDFSFENKIQNALNEWIVSGGLKDALNNPEMFAKGGGVDGLKDKYYRTYANLNKGFDLIYFDDSSDIDGDYKGTYETIELAREQAKKDGYTIMPIYNRYAKGGGVEMQEEKFRYKDFYESQGGMKFKTEEEAEIFIKKTKPFVRKQLREGNFVLVFNGKEYFIGEKIKINDEYANGGGVSYQYEDEDYNYNNRFDIDQKDFEHIVNAYHENRNIPTRIINKYPESLIDDIYEYIQRTHQINNSENTYAVGGSIEDEITYNNSRIYNLKELLDMSNEEEKANIQRQIDKIELENEKLKNGDTAPKAKKGFFGLF